MSKKFEEGFLKRAHAFGLDKYQALELLKSAAPVQEKESRKQKGKDFISQNFLGAVGDYLTPGGFGGTRAGKMTAMSKALGHEPGFATTNPLSSALLGGGAGALAGGTLGSMLNKTYSMPNGLGGTADYQDSQGTMLGVLGGGLLGSLLPAYLRRGEMQKNMKEYVGGAKVTPEAPSKLKGIGNLLLPYSGAHRKGEAIGYNKLRGIEEDQTMDHAVNAAKLTAPAAGLLGGAVQNYSADNLIDKKAK